MTSSNTTAIYIHWPFCKHKCPYCDFNSHVTKSVDYNAWEKAYIDELSYFLPYLENKKIKSIFFGGGTPSLMSGTIVYHLLEWLRRSTSFDSAIEITLEANPTSVESGRFKEYKDAGVNRLSLGIQSLRSEELKFLGRQHSVEEAKIAIDAARTIFGNYSFDLIYARPNQTLPEWKTELEEALALAGNHLSLYQLTIEKGTPFYSAYQKQEFLLPDEEASAQLYTMTNSIMTQRGFRTYEISNYAKPGYECQHNLQYWEYGDYLGIGPGAHSRITIDNEKNALMMIHGPEQWLASVSQKKHGIQQQHPLTKQEEWEEILMMGLRLEKGIKRERLETIIGKSLDTIIPSYLIEKGMIELSKDTLRTTEKGLLLTNSIVQELAKAL